MSLGVESFAIGPGDTICCARRSPHRVTASPFRPAARCSCCAAARQHPRLQTPGWPQAAGNIRPRAAGAVRAGKDYRMDYRMGDNGGA